MLVALFGRAHQADHNRFLADIEMAEAADQAHAVKLAGPLFKAADQKHVVIEFFEGFRVAFGELLACLGRAVSGSGKA